MLDVLSNIALGLGLDPASRDLEMLAGNNILNGATAQLDFAATDSQSTDNNAGSRSSTQAVAVTPTDAGAMGGLPIGIALAGVFANRRFRSRVCGFVRVLIFGTYTRGSVLILNSTVESAAGKRVFAYIMETGGVADSFTYATVWWNGLDGWAQIIATSGDEPDPPDLVEVIGQPPDGPPGGGNPPGGGGGDPPGGGPPGDEGPFGGGGQGHVVIN